MSGETEHGDPMCANPRLRCTSCGEFVYVTTPRHTETDHVTFECGCKTIADRHDFPEVWERGF